MLVIYHRYKRRLRVLGWKQTNAARNQTKTTNKWQKSAVSQQTLIEVTRAMFQKT